MLILVATVIIIMGSFAMLLPNILFVLQNIGADPAMATPALAAYSFAQFLAGPQWGRLSDRFGRRRTLAAALLGGAAAYGMMAAFTSSLAAVFVTMAAAGLCAGGMAIVFATVADITDGQNRTRGMGLIGAGIGIAFVIGTAIGGYLGGESVATASIVAPARGSSLACLAGFIMVLFWAPEPKKGNSSEQEVHHASRLAAFQRVARHPALLKLCLTILVFTFCLSQMESLIPLYVDTNFGWGPEELRDLLVYIGIILVVVQGGLVGPISKRLGERRMAQTGMFFMAAGLMLLAAIPATDLVYIGLLLTSVGGALFSAASLSLASHEAQDNEKGAVMGVVQSMQALGRSFGPMVAGAAFDINAALPFWIGGCIVACLLIVFRHLLKQLQRDRAEAHGNQ